MCFRIDLSAERPKRRKAYKVVVITRSGLVHSYVHNKQWQCNKTHSIRRCAKTKNILVYSHQAREGIYVYDTVAAARNHILERNYDSCLVIMRVNVDPADWLYSSSSKNSWDAGISTYRKVYVPEEQPYMKWY